MSAWPIRPDPNRTALTNDELKDALAYYGIPLLRLERQTEWTFRSIQRFLRADPRYDYPWFMDWVLLGYELHEDLRTVSSSLPGKAEFLPLPVEWGEREDGGYLSGKQLGRILTLYGVSPELFAEHLGRKPVAIQDYLDGNKDFIPPWMEWLLLLYHHHPELRTMRGRPALPLEKWKGAAEAKDHPADDGDEPT